MSTWLYVLITILVVGIVIVRYWRAVFKFSLSLVSQFSKRLTIKFENNDDVTIFFALANARIEAVVQLSFPIPTLGWTCVHMSTVRVNFDIFKLKRRSVDSGIIVKNPKKILSKSLPFWLRWLPRIKVDSLDLVVAYRDPPQVATDADRTGGKPWTSTISLKKCALSFELIHARLSVGVEKIEARCDVANRPSIQWLNVAGLKTSVQFGESEPPHIESRLDEIEFRISIEMFYEIIPTIAPLMEIPFVPGDRKQPVPVTSIPVSVGILVKKHVALEVLSAPAGSCELRINRLTGSVSKKFEMAFDSDGFVMTRDSPIHGQGDLVTLSAFKADGNGASLDFHVADALVKTGGDGLVYWIRAMVMCGTKISYTKKPYRVPARNARTQIFYDYELCGIEPKNWDEIPKYIPKIIPIQIRIFFDKHVLFHSGGQSGGRVFISKALLDVNLPREELLFSAENIEFFFGKRRCAMIRSFACWAPLFSGVRLKDSDPIVRNMGVPPDDVRCHQAAPTSLGPIPVCIRFGDVLVEHADDLITMIVSLVLLGVEDIKRWDQDLGYVVVPFYKPVTIRVSTLRFEPSELSPVVLDVKDWELAIGPTKDCLNFAFIGVKAWVPDTPTVPSIVDTKEPVVVKIRVRRPVPLSVAPTQAWEYSLQPGSWRDLDLEFPKINLAVAPGLHATTRFVDSMIKTFQRTIAGNNVAVNPNRKRGPLKNVTLQASQGVDLEIVHFSAGQSDGIAHYDDDLDVLRAALPEALVKVSLGAVSMQMENFKRRINFVLNSLDIDVPKLARIGLGKSTLYSPGNDVYSVELSGGRSLEISVLDNAMALYAAFSAIKDSITRAWFIDPRPKLNSVITHIVDINQTVSAMRSLQPRLELETGTPSDFELEYSGTTTGGDSTPFFRTPLVSGTFNFICIGGFEFRWDLPGTVSGMAVRIGKNQLQGEAVFHGFALLGDDIFRRLPDLKDPVLLQWLRYPWTVSADAGESSPGRERESWDLHNIMTMRISQYLNSAGEEGIWEYRSTRGLIDTPMYAQILLALERIEISLAGQRLMGTDKLEIRIHCHNLPTGTGKPKIKMSYWTSLEENPEICCIDFVPNIHVPVLLALVGSPADADPSGAVIPGFAAQETPQPSAVTQSVLEKILSHVDFGLRINLSGITGRAGGFVFAASKICLFKEEDLGGKGLIVCELRDCQLAMETALSVGESVQPLHSMVCQSTPCWFRNDQNSLPLEVFPLFSMNQMMVHVGETVGNTLFCSIQKVRVWWSPSLSRGLRLSMKRTEELVTSVSRWKRRFTNELFARLGRSRHKKLSLEMIMKIMDWFIPADGSLKLLFRCGDVQVNFHNLLHGVEDLHSSGSKQEKSSILTPPGSPDIPNHFLPFRESDSQLHRLVSPVKPRDIVACSCVLERKNNIKLPSSVAWLDLESPGYSSWWTRACHFQGCALPPFPLLSLFAPPNSRRERGVGAVSFDKWINDCHRRLNLVVSPEATSVGGAVKPKPRGSQLLLVATESLIELFVQRIKGPSNVKAQVNCSFGTIQGSVAPTALRGLVWLGQSGQTVLRQILQIDRFAFILSAELFSLRSAHSRLLVPQVQLSTDDDAFQIITDVFRNCILYRGQIIDPNVGSGAIPTSPSSSSPPFKTSGGPSSTGQLKRDAVIEGLLTALAVADASLGQAKEYLAVEYMIDSIVVNLTHRQRCFVTIQFKGVVGKQAFGINHPHRPMSFSFQVGDILMSSADRTVLRSTGGAQTALLAIRGNDRYITLNNKEWHVYDSLYVSTSPIVIDLTQDLIDEIYAFIFPPTAGDMAVNVANSNHQLPTVEEHVEVVGNKLLTGRNKSRASQASTSIVSTKSGSERKETPQVTQSASSAALVFFKFVRFGNIDSIITFKSKQISLNNMALTVKYYLKRRRLATWKEFFDEWATKVGKQALSAFVKHGFTRKKGIQDIIVNRFSVGSTDVDKLLFGKYAR